MRANQSITIATLALVLLLAGAAPPTTRAEDPAVNTQLLEQPVAANLRFCLGEQTCEVGDVNGDGLADLVAFTRATLGGNRLGEVWVALSHGGRFAQPKLWLSGFCIGNEDCTLGDVDGDGHADAIAFLKDTQSANKLGQVQIAYSTEASFGAPQVATYTDNNGVRRGLVFCIGNEVCRVGAMHIGSGATLYAYLAAFTRDTNPNHPGDVFLAQPDLSAPSRSASFKKPFKIKTYFCLGEEECLLGDVAGDTSADLLAFTREAQPGDAAHNVWVYMSTVDLQPDDFEPALWHDKFCYLNERCMVGNVDGSGKADALAFGSVISGTELINYMKIALDRGGHFDTNVIRSTGNYCPRNDICRIGDIDNNGYADVIAFNRGANRSVCASNILVTFFRKDPALTSIQAQSADSAAQRPTSAAHIRPSTSQTAPSNLRTYLPLVAFLPPLYCQP